MADSKIIITKDLMDKVVEELTEYRAIGTPTQILEKIGGLCVELGKYACIGTVEEFKALKEKSEPKKPDIEKFWGYDDLMCPGCKSYFVGEPKYCCKCGQKIDFGKEE